MDHSGHDHHAHHMPDPINATVSSTIASVMDHSGHGDHSGHDHSMMDHSAHSAGSPAHDMMNHMMSMAFHGGCNETILFTQWKTSSVGGLIWSMIVIFLFAVLYEGLKYYREHLFWKSYNALQYRAVTVAEKNAPVTVDDGNRVVHMVGDIVHRQPPSICSAMHFFQSILHLIQVTLSFLLMLIFMTYNTWLCLAVVFGAATGYFLFGWKKAISISITEHCH